MPLPGFETANMLSAGEVLELLRSRIRLERSRLGMSQRTFAEKCKIPLRTYKRLELGGCDSIEALIKVTQALGRAPGLDGLFPAPPLVRRIDRALMSIKDKLDAADT
jgi:transcriptional regulator with XRE-family HTH domain